MIPSLKILLLIIVLSSLAGGGYFIDQYFFKNPTQKNQLSLNLPPVTSKPVSLTLGLSSPDDNILVFSSDLLVQGQTLPETVVITSLNEENLVLDTNNKGEFSSTITLVEGVNQLTITVFDKDGNSKEETRTIYYSKEKI